MADWRSLRERARRLIDVVAPGFRERLERDARPIATSKRRLVRFRPQTCEPARMAGKTVGVAGQRRVRVRPHIAA